jgi:signal transduction histidine kinase/DNA-binding NarL/FixJ family response regulator
MPKLTDAKSGRTAFILVELSVAGFMILRILDSIAEGNRRMLFVSLGVNIAVILLIALVRRFRRTLDESFIIPMIIFLIFLISCLALRSFVFFFPVSLGLCCVSALYFNPRSLRTYIIITNIVAPILMFAGLPMTRPDRNIQFTEMMALWFISFLGSIFIYMVTVFASNKNNASNQAQESFSSLLASSPNRIVLMDSLNRVTYLSLSFLDLTNLAAPAMAIGRPVFDLFPDRKTKLLFHDILTADSFYEDTQEITLGGQQFYFEIISLELRKEEITGRLVNIIDVTPLMRAKFEAEAASRSKTSFLATMSHEIRTPLNAIIGLSEIELQKKLPMDTRLGLEKIHSSGDSLLTIINDILDISKIEAGSFELIPSDYDVPSMVNDTVHLNIVRIGSKNIVFKLEIDPTIPVKLFGDEVRVKQVLNNLLSNAFKYTEEGSVSLNIAWERRENDAWVIFTVSDTGRGIRQEDIPRLFAEYRQLDTKANRHIEGTGLGLSITRNLVELMGGTISLDSEYGKGSAFTVRIPQMIVDEKPIGEVTAKNLRLFRFIENRRSRGLNLIRAYMPYGKVLIVDDVETNLDVAKGLMLPYGLSIDCASGGREAIDKIRAAVKNPALPKYDLVLMDHMMPQMDGIEAVRIIRNEIDSDYARTVPIIALTANALAGNEEMFLINGFNAFISKPIDIMQLDLALNTWVKNKQNKETLLQAEMEQAARAQNNSAEAPGVLDGMALDGIDLVRGRERYNNEGAYLDILRSYHVHTPPLLEKLRTFTLPADGGTGIDISEYTIIVHGLKGSSYGICADAVGKDAEELEKAARAGDIEQIRTGSAPFIEKVELLLLDLKQLLRKVEAGKGLKQKAAAPDSALLEKLLDAVKRYKSSVMEEILAVLESFEYESGGELVAWLREQMDNLEYDAIRQRLENHE